MRPIGSGHNKAAKPFNASMPALVHKQYNSPLNIYSETNIAETLQAHSEVLATGVKGYADITYISSLFCCKRYKS